MSEILIISILLGHWLADFIFQSREMAVNKSHDNKALLKHVGVYSLVLLIFMGLASGFSLGQNLLIWVALNGGIHLITDYNTSRLAAYFKINDMEPYFWYTIGFDQFIHGATLLITAIHIL